MVFSSIPFIFFFLPLTLLAYYISPLSLRNVILVLFSFTFFLWGSGALTAILLASLIVNYSFIKQLGRADAERKKLWVTATVVSNVCLLAYFKYANFFVSELNRFSLSFGASPIAWDSVVLPIGISFYTFHAMSCAFDVSSGKVDTPRSFSDYVLYIVFFPQLVAGPIVRFHQISHQIERRAHTLDGFSLGVLRFAHGLFKKVVIADPIGALSDSIFSLPGAEMTTATAWLGAIAYTLQIYFDFSGYSDMAIGLARMFGFDFPENFRRPYSAFSITDFWRRWHISLSSWFRDYLYIPLGGNRVSGFRTYANLSLVFLVTGLWHGANWTFILWGAYHGLLLIAERVSGLRLEPKTAAELALRRALTAFLVILGWVLFRANNIDHALSIYENMFSPGGLHLATSIDSTLTNSTMATLACAALIFLMPARISFGVLLQGGQGLGSRAAWPATLLLAFPLAVIMMIASNFSPFLYFQF